MPKRKNKRRRAALDLLVYAATRLVEVLCRIAPPEDSYRFLRWCGDLAFRWDRRHRVRTREHVRRSFPHWPAETVDRVARESLRSLAFLGLEVLSTTRRVSATSWRRYIRLHDLVEPLRLILAGQQAVILLTGHFGNWEIVGYALAALGFPGYAVARPLNNPYLDAYVRGIRSRRGLVILDKKGVTGLLDQILSGSGTVGFLADQDAGRKGIFVDFFGRQASTFKSIALLAIRYEAPVVVGYGRRIGEAFRFEIGVERIVYPAEWAHRDDPVRWVTQQYTSAIERVARRAPEQYLWVHRRWKHRPKGEAPGPDGIA